MLRIMSVSGLLADWERTEMSGISIFDGPRRLHSTDLSLYKAAVGGRGRDSRLLERVLGAP